MNQYITADMIKRLREERGMTQEALASTLGVSGKAVSRWETGRGYPDITLLEPLSAALGISVAELLAGNQITNKNASGNIARSKFYICPICGNVLWAMGDTVISCCGVQLIAEEAEIVGDFSISQKQIIVKTHEERSLPDTHSISVDIVEDEYYVIMDHPMTKDHYISFFAAQQDDGMAIVKLYPEGNAQARFKMSRTRKIFAYCNHHGLFAISIKR